MSHEYYETKELAIAAGRPAEGFIAWYVVSRQTQQRRIESFETLKAAQDWAESIGGPQSSSIFIEKTSVYGNLNYAEKVEVL